MTRSYLILLVVLVMSFFVVSTHAVAENKKVVKVPVSGMVTLVDIGAKQCVPCKMMEPILHELAVEYKDRAAIIFIDAYEKPKAAQKLGISSIPTQIFYNTKGKEVQRHVGFLDKDSIVSVFHKLGVK